MSRSFTYFATLFLLWLGANTEVLAEEQSSTDLAEPGLTLYQLLLGNIALSDGDNQMAYEMLKSAAEKLNNTNIAELAWSAALKTQSDKQIIEATKIWTSMDPEAHIANNTLLLKSTQNQRGNEVQQLLNEFIAKNSKDPGSYVATLTRRLSQERIDLNWLEPYLNPIWEKYASAPSVVMAKAVYKKRQGEDKEACRAALSVLPGNGLVFRQKDLSWFSDNEDFATTAADICWSVMPEKSQRILETVIDSDPSSTVARLMYGKILARSGHADLALEQIHEAIDIDPDSPTVLYNAGELAVECKDFELAKKLFNNYITAGQSKNPRHDWSLDDVWLHLAMVYDNLKDYVAEAKALARYNPKQNASDIHIQETAAWFKAGKPDTAESVLLNAIEKDPNNERIYFNARIEILLKTNQAEKAIDILEKILDKDPDNTDILYHLALIYQRQERQAESERVLRHILDVNPDDAFASNGLGYYYAEKGIKLVEARRLIENAYRQKPLDWQMLDSMAWLCFREGRNEQAYYFALAAMRSGFHRVVIVHMLDILVALGRQDEAQSVFNELSRRLPNDPKIIELGKRLKLLQQ